MLRCHCKMCRTPLHAYDSHAECVSCLRKSHADAALSGTDCSHYESFSLGSLRSCIAFFSERESIRRSSSHSMISIPPQLQATWSRSVGVMARVFLWRLRTQRSYQAQRPLAAVLFTQRPLITLAFHPIAVSRQRCAATDSYRGGRCSYPFSSAPSMAIGWKVRASHPSKPCIATSALAGRAYLAAGQAESKKWFFPISRLQRSNRSHISGNRGYDSNRVRFYSFFSLSSFSTSAWTSWKLEMKLK